MYDGSTEDVDECIINVHYYYLCLVSASLHAQQVVILFLFANYKLCFTTMNL